VEHLVVASLAFHRHAKSCPVALGKGYFRVNLRCLPGLVLGA
jgi:hypothetical protein